MWEMFLAHVVKLNPPPHSPESSPRSPHSPLFLGRPGGRGGHDGTPIVLWITWPDSMVDHSRIPWFFTWETWAITWVSPDHLGFT